MGQTKQEQELTLLNLNLESVERDLESLFSIGIQLESIAALCVEHDDWSSPTARIAIEHSVTTLGLPCDTVSLEATVSETVDRIIKAIVAVFKRAYEAIAKWAGALKERLKDIYARIQAYSKEVEGKEPVAVEFKENKHMVALAIDGGVNLKLTVRRLQQVVDGLPLIKTSGEKIVYKFNNAKRMADVNAVTALSDDLMDYILKHYNMEGKKHVHTSKDSFPGNRRLVLDLTQPVPNFVILQDEGVEVEKVSFTAKEISDAIEELDLENVMKMIDDVEAFAKDLDTTMQKGFSITKGNRDVAGELLKLAAPINAMLQKPPRTLINYYTKCIAHLEAGLEYALKQSPDKP